jgi:hypothetical protein
LGPAAALAAHAKLPTPTLGVRFGEASHPGPADLEIVAAVHGTIVVHLPHERADLPPLTGVIMPDGTQRLFAPRGIGADQVVALFRYGIRVPDAITRGPLDA